MTTEEIRNNLLDQIKQINVTRRFIAKQIGVSEGYLRDMLSGKTVFPLDKFVAICDCLDINLKIKMHHYKGCKVPKSLIAEKYKHDMTGDEIAQNLDIDLKTVYNALKKQKVHMRSRGRRHVTYLHPKFEQIKQEYLYDNKTARELAKKYKMKQSYLEILLSQNKVYKNKSLKRDHKQIPNI